VTGVQSAGAIPFLAEREVLNAALVAVGAETGFWNDQGRPAPWPDDVDEWVPAVAEPVGDGSGEPF
jgi:hypothetical protein